jgi:hypothetical protein
MSRREAQLLRQAMTFDVARLLSQDRDGNLAEVRLMQKFVAEGSLYKPLAHRHCRPGDDHSYVNTSIQVGLRTIARRIAARTIYIVEIRRDIVNCCG